MDFTNYEDSQHQRLNEKQSQKASYPYTLNQNQRLDPLSPTLYSGLYEKNKVEENRTILGDLEGQGQLHGHVTCAGAQDPTLRSLSCFV